MRLKILVVTVLAACVGVPAALADDQPAPAPGTATPTAHHKQGPPTDTNARAQERAKRMHERAQERAKEIRERARERSKQERERGAKERDGAGAKSADVRCGNVLVAGLVREVAEGAFTVEVKHSNRQRLIGHVVPFRVLEQTIFRGKDALGDLAADDRVLVHGKGCTDGERRGLVAGKVQVKLSAS